MSNSNGAEVFIDGQDTTKKTNTNIVGLSTGIHTYKLTLPGYLDSTGTINIVPYVLADINVPLIPSTQAGFGGAGTYFNCRIVSGGNLPSNKKERVIWQNYTPI